jgi:hypothetical protein
VSAGEHLGAALAAEAAAYRALLAGEPTEELFRQARDAYLASHAETGPSSWGRLLGALQMAILAGDGVDGVARQAVAETDEAASPAASYVCAVALVCLGEVPDVTAMLAAGGAFERTARGLAALAGRDSAAYAAALAEIVADFEARDQHLSGVAVADTALVLERLAEGRAMAVRPASALVPG